MARGKGPGDIYGVFGDPDNPDFLNMGRLLWSLVVDLPSWVYRRVETASLVAEQRIRRNMSVDCRVPPEVCDLIEKLGFDRFFVPLRFVMRGSLLSFDLRLDRKPVPLLTREQNTMATLAMLYAAVDQCNLTLDDPRGVLGRVADIDASAAQDALAALGLGPTPGPDESVEAAQLRWAITTFDQKYLLLTDVPLEVARQRSVFKIVQELPQYPLRAGARRLHQEIAWEPMSFVFDTPDINAGGSYHFQFTAPDGLAVSDGTLLAASSDRTEVESFGRPTLRTSVLGLNATIGEVPPEKDSYAAVVKVQPTPDGLMRASAASAVFTTILLLIAAASAQRLEDEQFGPSITLLLVLPGVVSTYLARPGEHSMVSRVLRGIRVLMLTSAVIIYLAAGVLALGPEREVLRATWLTSAVISAVPATMLVVAVRRCRLAPWN